MRSKQLPGLPVLTLDDGSQLGKVKRVVINPREKRVAALLVAERGWRRQTLLPMEGVYALGSHAVTVNGRDQLIPIKDAGEFDALLTVDRVRILGTPVVTTGGELVGLVRDYEISGSGSVKALYIAKGMLKSMLGREPVVSGDLVVALGKDAIVVADQVIDILCQTDRTEDQSEARPAERKPFHLFPLPKEGDSPREDED